MRFFKTCILSLLSAGLSNPVLAQVAFSSFQLTDSTGGYISGTSYTNNLEPILSVQVQYSASPGLSVTDTPSQLTLWHLDDGSGSTALDSSNHNQPLTLNGSPLPSWVAGEIGGALQFDGSQNYAVTGDLSGTGYRGSAAGNVFTIQFWFKTTSGAGYMYCDNSKNSLASGTRDNQFSWNTSGYLAWRTSKQTIAAAQSYADGNWHFVAGAIDATGMYLYVDGSLAASGTSGTSNSIRTMNTVYSMVGGCVVNTGLSGQSVFPGAMDEIMIATVSLSAAQIQAEYELVGSMGHELGAPDVDLSTSAGADFSWTRISTAAFSITGADGSTSAETWTSTLSLSGFSLVQSTGVGAPTNQVMFLASSIDDNETTAQFTILVDTTPPSAPTFASLSSPTTYSLSVNGISGTDDLSGIASNGFDLQASTDPNFGSLNADSGWIAGPAFTFTGLWANTTYYVRARAQDNATNLSGFSSSQALATLAVAPAGFQLSAISTSAARLQWTALPITPSSTSAKGYALEASTAADFTGTLHSSSTADASLSRLTVSSLASDTTYYFRVGSLNPAGTVNYGSSISSSSWADPPINPAIQQLYLTTGTAAWTQPAGTNQGYLLQASSTNFNGSDIPASSFTANSVLTTMTVSGLQVNTTYYFRVGSYDWDGAPNYAAAGASSTLANVPGSPSVTAAYVSSVSLSWSLPAGGAEGFEVDASTLPDFSGRIVSSATSNAALAALTVQALYSATTYYFRVGSLDWEGVPNYAPSGSTVTLPSTDTSPPQTVTTLSASTNSATAISLSWTTPSPPDPDNDPLTGTYAIQYETYTAGVIWSTSAAQIKVSTTGVSDNDPETLQVTGLDPNTTFYFHLWTDDAKPNWSALSNAATAETLANPVSNLGLVAMATGSAAFSWAALPGTPSSSTSEGYLLQASTASDFTGTLLSSRTADHAVSRLTVSSLSPNTTYSYRLASLNWEGDPDFVVYGTSSTLADAPRALASSFLNVFASSAQVQWAALSASPPDATSEGYILQASTASDFSGTVLSSATADVADSTLTVSGLTPNSTYYFRTGSLNWGETPNFTVLPSTITLSSVPASATPAFPVVGVSSVTAQWGADGNPAGTRYLLELSTAPDFSGTPLSSQTVLTSATFLSLTPNTTYYGRVEALNSEGLASPFFSLASTMTWASEPLSAVSTFTPVYVTSLTVNFANGSPANPDGTFYVVEISSDSGFSFYFSSVTANPSLSASFQNLSINTTYYAQLAAQNDLGVLSPFLSLGSTSTLAVAPAAPGVYSNDSATGFSVTWSSGTPAGGYNPSYTVYDVQASSSSNFTGYLHEQIVQGNSASFGGLHPGTAYYVQAAALNNQNVPTAFVSLGSTLTLNSSQPAFINGSFLVSNASGTFQSYALYTNTTTPNLQIKVQSNYTPGLAVTDPPSDLALWHMDENTGATAYDSGPDANSLTLNGGYAWTSTGYLGPALTFDGSSAYAVSPDLSTYGWRGSNGAASQFTVEFWFKTTTAGGYLYSNCKSNTIGNSTRDNQFTWTTGNILSWRLYTNTQVTLSASSAYADGNWHFVAGTVDASGSYLYVDGSQVASNASATSSNLRTFSSIYSFVGGGCYNNSGFSSNYYFSGTMDEVRIATVPLSADQVAQDYDLGLGGHELGTPFVDLSTSAGADFSWTRISTSAFSLTGTNATTQSQLWASTLTLAGFSFIQSTAPGAPTNQVMFLASSIDDNETTAQFTILVDTTPPSAPTFASLSSPTTYSLSVNGISGTDDLSGIASNGFDLQASTDPNFGSLNADSGWIAGPAFTFTGLWANTTYYVRARAQDNATNLSGFSSSQALATLSVLPSTTTQPYVAVGSSYAAAGWIALPGPPAASSTSAEGYELQASTSPDFSGLPYSSATADVALSTLSISGLTFSTTIYFRVGSLNPAGAPNFVNLSPLDIAISTSGTLVSISLNPAVALSTVSASSAIVTNVGNIPVTLVISGSTATAGCPWVLSVSSGIEAPVLQGLWDASQPSGSSFATAITTNTLASGASPGGSYASSLSSGAAIPVGASRVMWFQFWAPRSTAAAGKQETIHVEFQAVYP